jgi:hypothetical protein
MPHALHALHGLHALLQQPEPRVFSELVVDVTTAMKLEQLVGPRTFR